MNLGLVGIVIVVILTITGVIAALWLIKIKAERRLKEYERALKMVPMLIHLPPATEDIQVNGRDERDVTNEAISEAQVMYSIIASTVQKGFKTKIYGQKHMTFEMVAANGMVKYYTVVPAVLTETVKQAVQSAYPAARLEEADEENIFSATGKAAGVSGGEFALKKEYVYPIATYEEQRWDAQTALLNAFSKVKEGEGMAVQVLIRPADEGWTKEATDRVQNIKDGKKKFNGSNVPLRILYGLLYLIRAPFEVPDERKIGGDDDKPLSQLQQEEIQRIEDKTKYPAFETCIRIIASSTNKARSEALLGGVIAAFSQFDSPNSNGFKYDLLKDTERLAQDYVLRSFPRKTEMLLNSIELATIYHLPSQNTIPTSQVERQLTKQVDGPARLVEDGVLLGVNEFRGEQKQIRLSVKDRRRHTYIIGATGMGKSVLLKNIAYQDMMDGKGFAFIDRTET